MISVISEVWLDPSLREGYVNWAAELKAELLKMDGFISIERFQSLRESDKLLSAQFWHDEACLTAWRNLEAYRAAQNAGRSTLFKDYRLRIAKVTRDYVLKEREQAPADSHQAHG